MPPSSFPPGEAFGDRNPEMLQWVARKLLDEMGDPDEKYQVGDVVQFPTPDGMASYAGVGAAGEDATATARPTRAVRLQPSRWRASP